MVNVTVYFSLITASETQETPTFNFNDLIGKQTHQNQQIHSVKWNPVNKPSGGWQWFNRRFHSSIRDVRPLKQRCCYRCLPVRTPVCCLTPLRSSLRFSPMDRKVADYNHNIPEQTESIIVRMSSLLVSRVSLGHILFCSKWIKGVTMVTWYSKQMQTRGYGGNTLFHI